MELSQSFNRITCLLFVFGILTSCQPAEKSGDTITKSASNGPFELIIEMKAINNHMVLITRKIKYNGDNDIQIRHSDPLISVDVSSDANDIEHTFDTIELMTELESKEPLTYGDPMEFEARKRETTISALADFEYDNKTYSIPLEWEY